MLGLLINEKKSQLDPSQEIVFLGLAISTTTMQVSLPKEKEARIQQEAKQLQAMSEVSVQKLAILVGRTTAAKQAIRVAPLFHRHLQALINRVVPLASSIEEVKQCYHQMVELSVEARQELVWWTQEMQEHNGAPLTMGTPDMVIESDASRLGWGATLKGQGLRTGGQWSTSEQEMHINCLELLAASLAIQTFAKKKRNIRILVRTDNISTRAYINHFGGTHSWQMNHLAMQIWKWCIERQIFLTAEHLPGVLNQEADEESRTIRDRCDWMLHPLLFSQIKEKMGPLEVDMFASRLTHQLPRYFSWRPDPAVEATDAFVQDWSPFWGYANPPWCLLLPTFAKIQREKAKVVLVAPIWKTQPWYPQLLCGYPLLIPLQQDAVISPTQEEFIMPEGVPRLAAWPLSGIKADQEGFLKELHVYWSPHGGARPNQHNNYDSLFKRWNNWCQERGRDPIRGPVADILNFLAELFEQGFQYRLLNAYRSAISSVHEKIDGIQVGKHPIVSRMLKGVFNERPPRPKYESVWKVDQVLTMFREDGGSASLSLQDLTVKTAMLLVLTRPCRGADLAALDLRNRSYVPEGVVFQPYHLSKQSRPSHHGTSFFFPSFDEDKRLCPVETLKIYEERTAFFHDSSGENRVFCSFIGKHGPVTSSTIARWLKTCLQKAGIDTSKFKAHSTRAAAATKAAMSGLTVDKIMKAADWSSEGVFQKFYYRPQHSGKFGSAVLAASASKSHVDMETETSEV